MERVEAFDVTCPAGTTQAAATETPLALGPCDVELIEITFPTGHAGLAGIAIAVAHQIIIPRSGTAWIRGSGNTRQFPVSNYVESGAYSAFTYNNDQRSHLWHVTFHVNDRRRRTPEARKLPIPPEHIYAALGR